MRMMRWDTW